MDNPRSVADQLCNASVNGNLQRVSFLLQNGADVNGFNSCERTALQVVKLGSIFVIRKLLEAGANPNVRDRTCGLTVLHDAAREGYEDAVDLLLNNQADPNIVDKKGNLPLHLAAEKGQLKVVRLLLDKTDDTGARNTEGLSPAELALRSQRLEVHELIQAHERLD